MKKHAILASVILTSLWGCGGSTDDASSTEASETGSAVLDAPAGGGQDAATDENSAPNILKVAVGSADHTTLVAAVKAAELTHVLANNGPITVFAPNNAAFDALPAGTVETLLKPESKATLQAIITHHASPGTVKEDGFKDGMSLYMASGQNIKVEVNDQGTFVGGAKILASVPTSNGYVHVVDKVLLPE